MCVLFPSFVIQGIMTIEPLFFHINIYPPTAPLSFVSSQFGYYSFICCSRSRNVYFFYSAYKKNFVHITIESFNENVTSARIEQSDKLDQGFRNFSCSRTNGTVEGRYNDKIQKFTDVDEHFEWSKLRCDFQVTIPKDKHVMGNQEFNLFWNEDKITYQVTLKSEKATFDNIDTERMNQKAMSNIQMQP
ncbi:hypothetical protein PRIPAC_85051 [Pristionchus pacificus]|nr:hypothetical protein PRIPAC_85051 [Pristionchus pacificus]